VLLRDIEHNAQENDDDNDDEARHFSGPGREPACEEKDDDEGTGLTLDDLPPELTATMHQCIVRTVFCQSPIGVSVGEAARLCMEAAQQLVERKIPGELNPRCSARCASISPLSPER
jgi:hypothetical protein